MWNDCYLPTVYQEKVDVWQKPGIWLVYNRHIPGTYQIVIFYGLQIEDMTSQGYFMLGENSWCWLVLCVLHGIRIYWDSYQKTAFHRISRHHLLWKTIIVHATLAYSFHTSFLIDFIVQPMKTEETTPIAARMFQADIMQFQERKAWYEECKKNSVHNWGFWLHRGN